MPAAERYEIIDTIAQGDYAVVYRTRDNELQREVAVKQIHLQYLQDPSKLDQYWQEAQLLASLEHPYIMTIYDIVRERGWLILELMQGSLQQQLSGNPIDLESLRLTLIYMLHALSFLEKNGIVHGDVKPSNLMLDKNNRVKLGDFGIARRMSGDDGSVVKGTTKYMAPEVVSDQFGPVGPHSDLYSLGFSAFELMCGSHFDTLFPGLNMFGRDQQIAWMMWHSALDRRLPEINRVLEGVPDDLAYVIQKLTEKDPNARYKSAEQVLDDLRTSEHGEMPGEAEAAKAEAAAEAGRKAKKKKVMVYAALALSLFLTVGMVFIPSGGREPVKQEQTDDTPTKGSIAGIDLERQSIAVRMPNTNKVREVKLGKGDRIELNGDSVKLDELDRLRRDDEVEIVKLIRKSGDKSIEALEIIATRPKGVQTESFVADVDASSSLVTLEQKDGDSQLKIYVPSSVTIWVNNSDKVDGHNTSVSDLTVGDAIRLTHVEGERYRVATSLRAKHVDRVSGKIVEIDPGKRRLTVQTGEGETGEKITLPLADQCVVTLNGVEKFRRSGLVVSLNNLKRDYDVSIVYDTHISRIDATCSFTNQGVVRTIDEQSSKIGVQLNEPNRVVDFTVEPETKLIAGNQQLDLSFLRPDDRLTITHQSVDLVDPVADAITVDPISDPRTWSVVIGRSRYGQMPLTHAQPDCDMINESLLVYYRVPKSQDLDLLNKSIDEIRSKLTGWLADVPADGQLIVYYLGHAFQKDGVPYLADEHTNFYEPKDGLPLSWLVQQLDACQAAEKILLLDLCHEGQGNFQTVQPSTEELVSLLSSGPTDPVSATVTIIGSCGEGQRGRVQDDPMHGRFATAVAKAFTGKADRNSDRRISADELFAFLKADMAKNLTGGAQTPVRFLPNPTPPRLAEDTKEAVRAVLALATLPALPGEADATFAKAGAAQPDEPDGRIAEALVYLSHGLTSKSQPLFAEVAAKHPNRVVPHQALAWQYFLRKKYDSGIAELRAMFAALPDSGFGDERDRYLHHAVEFAGTLRQFAMRAPEDERRLTIADVKLLNDEVLKHSGQIQTLFAGGVKHGNEVADDLERKIKAAPEGSKKDALIRELRRLSGYTKINYNLACDYLRATLEH